MSQNDCAAVRTQLSAYLDGELDDTARGVLAMHLENCADCRVFTNTLRKTLALYHARSIEHLSPQARANLERALELK